MKLWSLTNAVVVICVLWTVNASADDSGPTVTGETPAKAPIESAALKYDIHSVDAQAIALSAHYAGNNPVSIFKSIAVRLSPKDEFETTNSYKSRIAAALERPLIGTLTPKSTLALMAVPGTFDGTNEPPGLLTSIYDADNEKLTLTLPAFSNPLLQKFELPVYDKTLSFGSYASENAMGVKMTVKKRIKATLSLDVQNAADLGISTDFLLGPPLKTYDLAVKTEEARAIKQNVRLLVLFDLVNPFVACSKMYFSPTIKYPTDTTIHCCYLVGTIKELWLYDWETGKIYAKFKPHQ